MKSRILSSPNKKTPKTRKIKQTKVFLNTTPSLFTKKPTNTFYQNNFSYLLIVETKKKKRRRMGIELDYEGFEKEDSLQARNPKYLHNLWPIQFLFSFSSYIYTSLFSFDSLIYGFCLTSFFFVFENKNLFANSSIFFFFQMNKEK